MFGIDRIKLGITMRVKFEKAFQVYSMSLTNFVLLSGLNSNPLILVQVLNPITSGPSFKMILRFTH